MTAFRIPLLLLLGAAAPLTVPRAQEAASTGKLVVRTSTENFLPISNPTAGFCVHAQAGARVGGAAEFTNTTVPVWPIVAGSTPCVTQITGNVMPGNYAGRGLANLPKFPALPRLTDGQAGREMITDRAVNPQTTARAASGWSSLQGTTLGWVTSRSASLRATATVTRGAAAPGGTAVAHTFDPWVFEPTEPTELTLEVTLEDVDLGVTGPAPSPLEPAGAFLHAYGAFGRGSTPGQDVMFSWDHVEEVGHGDAPIHHATLDLLPEQVVSLSPGETYWLTVDIEAGGIHGVPSREILVDSDITSSTTWSANNTYNLQKQVYVRPGATLTIEPGTVIASTPDLGGSLAVCKGARIFVLGTRTQPVIMTSKADVATWTEGDPRTGTWREEANEWGNLTLLGGAYISDNAPGNTPCPHPSNVAAMEGLVQEFPGDTKVLYGGSDDQDDSGVVHYLSLRYGGKAQDVATELNALSLGGIGRETDIHHIDVMNGVDDGIEIFGGTVDLKHFNVWNVGDDSFDVDQGWRGRAQFGLLVQGYSLDAPQGSGVGDNVFELDGAEDSHWEPVTTATIYNCTIVGQPVDGDHATAWRDGARVQFRNCIFMDVGERLVGFDNVDGDGGAGYGANGTLSWPAVWSTASTWANPCGTAALYQAQTSGRLAEIRDSVFFRNLHASAYTEANARGVFDAANQNVLVPGTGPLGIPIRSCTRGPAVLRGARTMLPVIRLDPRPANEALHSAGSAPNDGFFTPAPYRGALGLGPNWLAGWTASGAFGLLVGDRVVGHTRQYP